MAQLAIQGHLTRGSEIIALLEMLVEKMKLRFVELGKVLFTLSMKKVL